MPALPFIAVEGPIGVGKTSLARAISRRFHYYLVEEIAEANPFLGKFYQDTDHYSFQTEMFFLCNRFKQLEDLDRDVLSQNKAVVADYHIFKNQIFAARTLQPAHLDKYQCIYPILTEDLPKPNIVIYLTASMETLLARIRNRGREAEANLTPDYLQHIKDDYAQFMSSFARTHPDVAVLDFNGDTLDFVYHTDDLEMIFTPLKQTLEMKGNRP